MIRVIESAGTAWSLSDWTRSPHSPIKYYNNQVSKEEVKKDFDIILDKEIEKLKIDIFC